jgi:hypothetical protein
MCAMPKDNQQKRLTVTYPFDIFLWPLGISLWHLIPKIDKAAKITCAVSFFPVYC